MTTKKSFHASKATGDFGEKVFLNLLKQAGIDAKKNDSKNKQVLLEYDVVISLERQILVEVKYDRMARVTQNVCLEYFNTRQGKPSGIAATKSELWCLVLDGPEVWLANTGKLKEFFSKTKPVKDLVGGDDNSAMKLYRKEDILEKVFVRLDEISAEEVKSTINRLLEPS